MKQHIPMRRCIGCMKSYPQDELIRIVFDHKSIKIDINRYIEGRGAYLCKNNSCAIEAKKKKRYDRTFKYNFENNDIDNLIQEVISIINGGN